MTATLQRESGRPLFVSMGLFIIDTFLYLDEDGKDLGVTYPEQECGGGTYAAIGARIWLKPEEIGMIVDRGGDFTEEVQSKLDSFGKEMWHFRDSPDKRTTRSVNIYRGNFRTFDYLTPRTRITPKDLRSTRLFKPSMVHLVCSPKRAFDIIKEVLEVEVEELWDPLTIYEPMPDRCVPEELPALKKVLPYISILSPNAEEALSLLSVTSVPTKENIEAVAKELLSFGVGRHSEGTVIIRSGALGSFVVRPGDPGRWIDAFWTAENTDKVVDVTGAGNSFLGGLAAGLALSDGDVYDAALYATVSASFIIEQGGLPTLVDYKWNGESPSDRLMSLRKRMEDAK